MVATYSWIAGASRPLSQYTGSFWGLLKSQHHLTQTSKIRIQNPGKSVNQKILLLSLTYSPWFGAWNNSKCCKQTPGERRWQWKKCQPAKRQTSTHILQGQGCWENQIRLSEIQREITKKVQGEPKDFPSPTTTNGSVIQNVSWHLKNSGWPERKCVFKSLTHWEHTDVQFSYICAL